MPSLIPAKTAVAERIVMTIPIACGEINPAISAVAQITGVTEISRIYGE